MQSELEERRPSSLPDDLVSPKAKLVYLSLTIGGETTATDLQETLGLPKSTVLRVLSILSDRGLVRRTDDGYTTA